MKIQEEHYFAMVQIILILVDLDITIKDFAFNNDGLYVIANSFSGPDEIYQIENGQLMKNSKANDYFVSKVKTHKCVYERINTGESEIDTWGIFVDKDRPTLLNIHGGPASQYGFTFFDEFQTYASAGFNVIACNPRGSSGRGHDFLKMSVETNGVLQICMMFLLLLKKW
jgi:dipeptidyl aminopeptidase/acylaminoacyl peptidase